MNEYGDSFLLAPFREFYREVIRLKHIVRAGAWVAPPGATADADLDVNKLGTGTWVYFPEIISEMGLDEAVGVGSSTWVATPGATTTTTAPAQVIPGQPGYGAGAAADYSEHTPEDDIKITTLVWQRLLTLFERQAVSAWRYGGTHGSELYKEAQYVMVALADEIFLHTEWEGKRAWVSNLLESKIFQSHVAGDLIFQKLDRLLHDRDPVYKDLAVVYLMALSLGFRGKYRGVDDHEQIARYREQLFSFIFRRAPDLDNELKHLFPEAYFHTLRQEIKRTLPYKRIWIGVLSFVFVTYLVATHFLWNSLTWRIDDVNAQIATIVQELGRKR